MAANKKDPKVFIFGQQLDTEQWERDASQRIVWGSLLLFAGTIFMLNTLDLLPWRAWENILRFWPLLLILAGLNVMLGFSAWARWLMALLTISTFGLVLLSILDGPFPNIMAGLPDIVGQAVRFLKDLVN